MRRTDVASRFQVSAEINVTPLIDVMLVLLIIFMVITPALVPAALPQARTAESAAKDHVTLAVDAGGNFYLGTRSRLDPVPEARLLAALEVAYRSRPGDHVLYLKADREAGYGRVLAALDAARAAGVRTVGAITRPAPSRRAD